MQHLSPSITLSRFRNRGSSNGDRERWEEKDFVEKNRGEWTKTGEQLQRWAKTLSLPMCSFWSIFLKVKDSLCCMFHFGLFFVTSHKMYAKVFANRLLLTHMGVIYIYQWLSSLSFICLSLCLCRHYAPPLNLISLCLSGRFLSLSVLILAPCVCVVACRAEWETEEAKLCPAAACVRRRDFCLFGWVDAQHSPHGMCWGRCGGNT